MAFVQEFTAFFRDIQALKAFLGNTLFLEFYKPLLKLIKAAPLQRSFQRTIQVTSQHIFDLKRKGPMGPDSQYLDSFFKSGLHEMM